MNLILNTEKMIRQNFQERNIFVFPEPTPLHYNLRFFICIPELLWEQSNGIESVITIDSLDKLPRLRETKVLSVCLPFGDRFGNRIFSLMAVL